MILVFLCVCFLDSYTLISNDRKKKRSKIHKNYDYDDNVLMIYASLFGGMRE